MLAGTAHREGLKNDDISAAVVERMRLAGVSGIPRNYELFYEAFVVSNGALADELTALGLNPKQEDLDRVGLEHSTYRARAIEDSRQKVLKNIEEITGLLVKEISSLERFGDILGESSASLNGGHEISKEVLSKMVGIMAVATTAAIEQSRQSTASMAKQSDELQALRQTLEDYKKLADTDPLTQLLNRRGFDRLLAAVYNDGRSVLFGSLILADIDKFKDVNDRYGHLMGDKVLQSVAKVLRSCTNSAVVAARTGGEEFALVVNGLTEQTTVALADEVRRRIEAMTISAGSCDGPSRITVSIGVCAASEAKDPEDLYFKADYALYSAKMNGRNRTCKFPVPGEAKPRKNWLLYREN